ncbi:hypothetical protein DL98DRAFT_656328 [Cadophora sp. DSE1049]|nr:hypothetical protein DL98DRAFT_656328 [Cadophora sp. DSE1049]
MAPRLWSAYYALGITSCDSDGMTCVGLTKKGHHCDAEIEKDSYDTIRAILNKLEASTPDASRWPKSLKNLSVHSLCSRHQSQASDLVNEWTGCVQEAATTYDIKSATKQLQEELDDEIDKVKQLEKIVEKFESRGIAELHAEIEDLQAQRAADQQEHSKEVTQDRDDLLKEVIRLERRLDLCVDSFDDSTHESYNSDTDKSFTSTKTDDENRQLTLWQGGGIEFEYELRDAQLRTQQLANRVDILEEELSHERARSSCRISTLERRLQIKETECTRLAEESTFLHQRYDDTSLGLGNAMEETDRGRLELANLKSMMEENHRSLASTELQLATASQELSAAHLELTETTALLAAARADLETSRDRQATDQDSIISLQNRLGAANERLSSIQASLECSWSATQTLNARADGLRLELHTEKQVSASLRQELEKSSQQILETNSALRQCQLKLEGLTSDTATAREELAAEQKFSRSVRFELETRLQDLSTTNRHLGDARKKVEATSAELIDMRDELKSEQSKGHQLREELVTSQRDLAVASNALASTQQDLLRTRTSLQEAHKAEGNSALTTQLHQKQTDLIAAHQQLSATKTTLHLFQTSLKESHEPNEQMRTSAAEMEKEHATPIATLTDQIGGTDDHPLRSLMMSFMELIQKWRDAVARYFRSSRSVRTLGASDDLEAALMIRKDR